MNKILKAKIFEKFGRQADFARVVKVHESFVSRVVQGRRKLSPELRKSWALTLQCNEKKLFGAD